MNTKMAMRYIKHANGLLSKAALVVGVVEIGYGIYELVKAAQTPEMKTEQLMPGVTATVEDTVEIKDIKAFIKELKKKKYRNGLMHIGLGSLNVFFYGKRLVRKSAAYSYLMNTNAGMLVDTALAALDVLDAGLLTYNESNEVLNDPERSKGEKKMAKGALNALKSIDSPMLNLMDTISTGFTEAWGSASHKAQWNELYSKAKAVYERCPKMVKEVQV